MLPGIVCGVLVLATLPLRVACRKLAVDLDAHPQR